MDVIAFETGKGFIMIDVPNLSVKYTNNPAEAERFRSVEQVAGCKEAHGLSECLVISAPETITLTVLK